VMREAYSFGRTLRANVAETAASPEISVERAGRRS